jgi:hypothetical protein
MNTAFLKIKLLNDFLKTTQAERQRLINEAIVKTNNSVVKMRRFRMLSQLAEYESVTINKIMQLESDNVYDFIINIYLSEIYDIVNRSG